METCKLKDFLSVLEPWLDRDYIHRVRIDAEGQLLLFFVDGGKRTYRIDDCTSPQLDGILDTIRQRDIPVERID